MCILKERRKKAACARISIGLGTLYHGIDLAFIMLGRWRQNEEISAGIDEYPSVCRRSDPRRSIGSVEQCACHWILVFQINAHRACVHCTLN